MSSELDIHRPSSYLSYSETQQEIDAFCRRMSERAKLDQKLVLLTAAYQIYNLNQDVPLDRLPRGRLLMSFLRRFAAQLIEFSGLKYLHLLFRSFRKKKIAKNTHNQASQRVSSLIIDVVPDENHPPRTEPVYRLPRLLLSNDNDRSEKQWMK
jgi:hypothetical protein